MANQRGVKLGKAMCRQEGRKTGTCHTDKAVKRVPRLKKPLTATMSYRSKNRWNPVHAHILMLLTRRVRPVFLTVYSNKLQLHVNAAYTCIIQIVIFLSSCSEINSVLLQNMIDSMKTIKPSYFISILEGSVGIKYILKLEENCHELFNITNTRGRLIKTKTTR